MQEFCHQPVMVEQVLHYLQIRDGTVAVDATVGCGGHAEAIMKAAKNVHLLGIDQDPEALRQAAARLREYGSRVRLREGPFSQLATMMRQEEVIQADAILFDFGFSSLQLDCPERGFSFRQDGPLDMRMNRRNPVTASTLLNRAEEDELTLIFRRYGEEPKARRIARAIVERRRIRPWTRTGELAELIEKVIGGHRHRSGPPPPTRCFQALRIAVNHELEEIEKALPVAIAELRPGGRIVTICFHSLEDRIVKNIFREATKTCLCPPDFPQCVCHKKATLQVLTRRPLRPKQEEIANNRRAAPSRLRAAEKI